MRILFKKYYRENYYRILILFYKKYFIDLYFNKNKFIFNSHVHNTVPKRQHRIALQLNNFSKNISAGLISSKSGVTLKYYKRSLKINATIVTYIQSILNLSCKYIYLYSCYNFNFRQWIFLQKYILLINPTIFFFQQKKSHNTLYRPIKRIKKRVTKLLKKMS